MKRDPNDKTTKIRSTDRADAHDPANPDPITGAPGAHPVGTGVGAAAGGATGAAIGAVGGPVGAAVGLVAGSIIGGLAGKAGGESVNPTVEDAYWRETHTAQPFGKSYPYDYYAGAYRTGYEGYTKYGCAGKTFEECEAELQADYARNKGTSNLTWEQARPASQAAWKRLSDNQDQNQPSATVDEDADVEAPRYATDPSNRDRQQAARYEPKERSKP
jgi:hypothetical protein